ncbi:hypothetical protein DPMN_151178 [Dreissena polymorpha]|uniref:Uncharacterized protein n=1 Tax=Dreissena polymorpha TaxID=45954 RepID=A0A9D4FH41_DREPO|nr:hypothetical protein DPMN_151178 [Dreissena polymorpha]
MELTRINLLLYKLLSVWGKSCLVRNAAVYIRVVVVQVQDGPCRLRVGPCLYGAIHILAVLVPVNDVFLRADNMKFLNSTRVAEKRATEQMVTDSGSNEATKLGCNVDMEKRSRKQ